MKLIDEVLKSYGLNILKVDTLSGGWLNEKYLIEDTNQKMYVLKELSLEKFPHNHLQYLIQTVQLQNYLYKENVVVPKILLNKTEEVVSKFSNNKYFFIQEYVNGYSKEFSKLTEEEIFSIGKNLAFLHTKLEKIDLDTFKSDFLKYKNINELKMEIEIKKQDKTESSSKEFIHQLNLAEKILNDNNLNKILNQNKLQLIHGDFTPDNIIFDGNEVKSIIDFELVRVNSKLQDIGRIILSTSFFNNKFNLLKLKSFINGYSTISKITYLDIIDSFKIVWINEFNIWIQDRYFKNYNPPKVEKFISEISWISENWFNLENEIGGIKKYEFKKH